MKAIVLDNEGNAALVDDADYTMVNKYRWYLSRSGYAVGRLDGKTVYMHRFITKPELTQIVDHKNNNRLDNRRENLRCCTITENNRNKLKSPGKTSKYKGAHYDKSVSMWKVRVADKYIGAFKTEEEAALAYDKAAPEKFGEFASINNIDPENVIDNRRKKTSKYYGVSWFERDKGWKAQLVIDSKNTALGVYNTEEEAAVAYNVAAKQHRPGLPLNEVDESTTPVKRSKVKNIYAGVSPQGNRWLAYASIDGKRKYVGSYDTPEEARDARQAFIERNG